MPVHELPPNVVRDLRVGLAFHLGIDKPVPQDRAEADRRKIVRMDLRQRDSSGRESPVTEWDEHDLKNGLDTLVHSIQASACRDAAYLFAAEASYALIFNAKDHPNRSRLLFKIPAGQEVQHIPTVGGRDLATPGIAERLMPDILRYVQAKEEVIDRRDARSVDLLMRINEQYASVIGDYTSREMQLREVTLNADAHAYQLEKVKRADEKSEELRREIIDAIKTGGPKLLKFLPAFAKLAGFSVPDFPVSTEFPRSAAPSGFAAPPSPAGEANAEADGKRPSSAAEGSVATLTQLRARVAVETMKTVSLLRWRNHLDSLRAAMDGDLRTDFDALVSYCSDPLTSNSPEGLGQIADQALAFGRTIMASGAAPMLLVGLPDDISRAAMMDLARVLEAYLGAAAAESPHAPDRSTAAQTS